METCSPTPSSFSPATPSLLPRGSSRLSDLAGRGHSPAKFSSHGDARISKNSTSSTPSRQLNHRDREYPRDRDHDSGLGRGSGNSTGLPTLNEDEAPFGMVRTYAPVEHDTEDYALPPDAHNNSHNHSSSPMHFPAAPSNPSPYPSPYCGKANSHMTLPRNGSRDTVVLSANSSPMHFPPPSLRTSLIPTHETVRTS